MLHNSDSPVEGSGKAAGKQAACLSCRRSKMKCVRNEQSSACTKCQRNGTECVVRDYRVGRNKGAKNKRSGLEKAVFQIEEALRKSQAGDVNQRTIGLDLQDLLKKPPSLEEKATSTSLATDSSPEWAAQGQTSTGAMDAALNHEIAVSASDLIPAVQTRSRYSSVGHYSSGYDYSTPHASRGQGILQQAERRDLTDAENPLQLLAQTSELLHAPVQTEEAASLDPASTFLQQRELRHAPPAAKDDHFDLFFGRFRPRLDVGDDLDPIELGLITLPEAETLFEFFAQNLAHTRWGIDPEIHTTALVRSRSAFLFTSICAASALFIPSTSAIAKRLSIHSRKLAHSVLTHRNRSVEIVLAFMISVPWMVPGNHWADDETCAYLAAGLTIAMDLSLHKIVRPSPSRFQLQNQDDIPSADCISGEKALQLDGFDDIEPTSTWGRRLLRRRERTWLALFVLERGVCLARGRNYTLPMTPLVETCDKWHVSDIADTWDGAIISVAVLRRELAGLVFRVRSACDGHQLSQASASETTQSIKSQIEGFFDRWYSTWPFQIGDRKEFRLPPYVEILASHTRLSLYSSVINHPTAPVEVKHYFRAAGLASALNVMRAAVQGESRLKSMPNNTAIMISFAACFALELSAMADENRASLAPSVQNLIMETADVLARIGATPPHRNGASALYAKQLRKIVQRASPSNPSGAANVSVNSGSFAHIPQTQHPTQEYQASHVDISGAFLSSEPVTFSGMSNDEIVEAINNAGVGLEMSWADFQLGDGASLDWMDWPT
jgi:hypothetical protein